MKTLFLAVLLAVMGSLSPAANLLESDSLAIKPCDLQAEKQAYCLFNVEGEEVGKIDLAGIEQVREQYTAEMAELKKEMEALRRENRQLKVDHIRFASNVGQGMNTLREAVENGTKQADEKFKQADEKIGKVQQDTSTKLTGFETTLNGKIKEFSETIGTFQGALGSAWKAVGVCSGLTIIAMIVITGRNSRKSQTALSQQIEDFQKAFQKAVDESKGQSIDDEPVADVSSVHERAGIHVFDGQVSVPSNSELSQPVSELDALVQEKLAKSEAPVPEGAMAS